MQSNQQLTFVWVTRITHKQKGDSSFFYIRLSQIEIEHVPLLLQSKEESCQSHLISYQNLVAKSEGQTFTFHRFRSRTFRTKSAHSLPLLQNGKHHKIVTIGFSTASFIYFQFFFLKLILVCFPRNEIATAIMTDTWQKTAILFIAWKCLTP